MEPSFAVFTLWRESPGIGRRLFLLFQGETGLHLMNTEEAYCISTLPWNLSLWPWGGLERSLCLGLCSPWHISLPASLTWVIIKHQDWLFNKHTGTCHGCRAPLCWRQLSELSFWNSIQRCPRKPAAFLLSHTLPLAKICRPLPCSLAVAVHP